MRLRRLLSAFVTHVRNLKTRLLLTILTFAVVVLFILKSYLSENPVLILLYNSWGSHEDWKVEWQGNFTNTGKLRLKNCPFYCTFTRDQDTYASTADYVVVQADPYLLRRRTSERINSIWSHRKKGQIWTAIVHEPPTYSNMNVLTDDKFHWIASYRQDSDVYWPYGRIQKLDTPRKIISMRGSFYKKKLAAWLVSRCNGSTSQREQFVESLQKHIPIHVFGRCGKQCPSEQKCRQFIGSNYKFYLALENSLCIDYVTEKFFTALEHGAIPVVYGWANYSKLAPPKSFINALDFKSVKALADYLLWLDKNPGEYVKYFYWTRQYRVVNTYNQDGLCHMCEQARAWNEGGQELKGETKPFPSLLRRISQKLDQPGTFKMGRTRLKVDGPCVNINEHSELKRWLNGGGP